MTENNKYEVSDLVTAAIEAKPTDFGAAFSDLMVDRLRNAVATKKQEIAHNMFAKKPEAGVEEVPKEAEVTPEPESNANEES